MYFDLRVGRETLRGRPAVALGLVNERLEGEDEPKRELFERRIALLEELGWEHWTEYDQRWVLVRFPVGDPIF
jgi:tripeptidyl-peptidase-2